jgi:hypothetical protein
MTTGRWTVFGVVAVVIGSFAAVSPTLALTITRAKIAKGAVQVRGKDAVPDATITCDGQIVGQANSRGRFSFETTTLPPDCVGEVSDGVETVEAVVQLCGPVGQSPGPLIVKDANGAVLGTVFDFKDIVSYGSHGMWEASQWPLSYTL